ncbi:ComEC/Rec2 family competence protein [Spirosoma daeguense]
MIRFLILALLLYSLSVKAQQTGSTLPNWEEGQLDIYHINTGQGNATFAILPDGTTLLVDAGAINSLDWRINKPRNIPTKPDNTRQAGEWIARYIRNTLRFQKNPVIDYAMITHFHDDHMGTPLNVTKRSDGGYVASGITEVADYIPIRKIIDRGWPDYTYPRPFTADSMVSNYRQFLKWQIANNNVAVERFQAGRSDQIVLRRKAATYQQQFDIRNLAVNGKIWTGKGSETQAIFPDLSTLKPAEYPNENMCSIVFLLRYGDFTYFSGGDIQGVLQFGAPAWHDVETPIAKISGPVDVHLLNHHGYPDSENGTLLASLRPRVLVIPAWASSHPGRDVLERVFSNQSYKGPRDVFAINLLNEAKPPIQDLLPRLKSESGHVVIRVDKGGKTYRVLILDDTNESFKIKAVHGPYSAR